MKRDVKEWATGIETHLAYGGLFMCFLLGVESRKAAIGQTAIYVATAPLLLWMGYRDLDVYLNGLRAAILIVIGLSLYDQWRSGASFGSSVPRPGTFSLLLFLGLTDCLQFLGSYAHHHSLSFSGAAMVCESVMLTASFAFYCATEVAMNFLERSEKG